MRAIFFFLLNGVVAFYLHHLAFSVSEESVTLFQNLQEGTSEYQIRFHGECVGSLSLTTTREAQSTEIEGSGTVRLRAPIGVVTPTFSLSLLFNSYYQLGSGLLKLSVDKQEFQLGLSEINPILLRIREIRPNPRVLFTTSIPGPVQLVQHKVNSWNLTYPPLSRVKDEPKTNLLPAITENLRLSPGPACPSTVENSGATLDLTPLLSFKVS